MSVGAGKPEICRAGGRLEAQVRVGAIVLRQNYFSSGRPEFFLLSPWMRPTH